MYAKLFTSIYQGTLRGNSHGLLVFTNLLAHADREGFADIHPRAISEEVGLTLEEVKAAIAVLESPDDESRSPEEQGRRIVRMDEHRIWGWKIVNYVKYRSIRDEDDRREQNRIAQANWRAKQADSKQRKPESATVKACSDESAHTEAEAEAEAEDQKRLSADKPLTADPEKHDSKQERLAQVTSEAIATYNATLAKPAGLLPAIRRVGLDKRRQQVFRCVKVAREICAEQHGSDRITAEFWEAYFAACAQDDFLSGRGPYTNGHANWLPDFEYLTRPATLLKVYERTAGDSAE